MHSFVTLMNSMLQDNFTGLIADLDQGDVFDVKGWGVSRAHEFPISLAWLYENHPRDNAEVIWETMELMFEGSRVGGQDWTGFFVDGVFPTGPIDSSQENMFTHGVNLAQGKQPSVLLHFESIILTRQACGISLFSIG